MSLKALLYAYVLGGITFIPLLIVACIAYTIYTSEPVDEASKKKAQGAEPKETGDDSPDLPSTTSAASPSDVNDLPKVRRGWLTVRRTFEELPSDASYVGMVRGFLDARSKDAKRSRPKDMWYVVLKGKVLYLYEDESMTECEAAIELGGHDVAICPEGLADGELFSKRNALCLRPRAPPPDREMPSVTREMRLQREDVDARAEERGGGQRQRQRERERLQETERRRDEAREQALDTATPWFVFVRSVVEMEDWYHAFVHASEHPAGAPTLAPLQPVFRPQDMLHLVATLDEQPDVIPMRWLNALLGRVFFSYYRTQVLENYIIGRLMKKVSKIKRPGFLSDIVVREVSVGTRAPTLSKPMLKELTKEGDASLEVHLHYKGEIRITVEATATINLGARFKTYTVKLVLALVIREIEGNLLVKVKRPPSSRLWYAFTQMPRIVLDVEPVVSDRQITWNMILSTIESKVKEAIQDSVVLPNMDDISFFDSSKYQHRGGIWTDASRRASSFPDKHDPQEDTLSAASGSAAELSKPAPTDPEHPPFERSHSAQEAELDKPPLDESLLEFRRAASSVSTAVDSSLGAHRRSWFAGRDSLSETPTSNDADIQDGEQRGRTSETEGTLTRRSSSTPVNARPTESQENTPQPSDAQKEGDDYLSPSVARRSSSQHSSSSSRDTSAPLSSDDESSGAVIDSGIPSASWRSKSPSANSSGRNAASSTAAFLQTLKSRAGDKQALSNTAKEAMRKWGVNWSGLRRDGGGNAAEEVPDGAASDQRRQMDSRSHRSRPSYAEVRAAIEQRKDKEYAPSHGETTPSADSRSDPISIPQSDKGKARARSTSPSSATKPSSAGASPYYVADSPNPAVEGTASSQPRSVSPSIHRTDSDKSARSFDKAATTGLAPEDEPERPPSPIHTQPPQAKTMTIPGIHASHRGEVMSMGYAPPTPPPAEKKPAIQSVYRLWKNQGVPPSLPPRGTGTPPQAQTGFAGQDQDAATQSSSGSAPEVVAPRPVPPPLPPRSISTNALRNKPDTPAAGTAPSASAALQSIVSKDRSKRASLEPVAATPSGATGSASEEGASSNESATASTPASSSDAAASISTPSPPSRTPPALPPRRPTAVNITAV